MSKLLSLVFLIINVLLVISVEVKLEKEGCICPEEYYICHAIAATSIRLSSDGAQLLRYRLEGMDEAIQERDGLRAEFIFKDNHLTAKLSIIDIARWNKSDIACRGDSDSESGGSGKSDDEIISICITGPASAPRDLSVLWDDPHAKIKLRSSEYGGECVQYYMATANAKGEKEIFLSCNQKNENDKLYTCLFCVEKFGKAYTLTVWGVTKVSESISYNGDHAMVSDKSFIKGPDKCRPNETYSDGAAITESTGITVSITILCILFTSTIVFKMCCFS